MKIIRLTAENVKRLRAVEITPSGDVVTITGRNAQGKTSVLDAIWLAVGGGAAGRETVRPIRDGEDHAAVTLDLGDLVVTRTWTGDKTSLTVKSADGARYPSPQGVLDALVGRLSFDPLEFTRLSAREQTAALLDLVDLGIDLDALAHQRQALYDRRTEVGRQGKALGEVPALHPGVPDAEQSASDLIGRIRAAQDANRDVLGARASADMLRGRVAELERELATASTSPRWRPRSHRSRRPTARFATTPSARAARPSTTGSPPTTRRSPRRSMPWTRRRPRPSPRRSSRSTGSGFDESGVVYNGVPFSQASSAEQIRVSLAMAMALNPKLRVIRILDGSLLDADNLALIGQMATAADFQVWIERVSDDAETAVVIEDGAVA